MVNAKKSEACKYTRSCNGKLIWFSDGKQFFPKEVAVMMVALQAGVAAMAAAAAGMQ